MVSYVDRKRKADDSSLYNAPAKKAAAGSNHSAAAAAGTGPASSIMINVEADSLRPDYLRSAGDVSTSSASPLHSLNQGVSGFSAAPRLTLQRSLTTSLKAINLSDLSLSSPTTCGGSVRAVAGSMQKA